MKRLTEVVGELEKGQLPLDQSLSLFEEGVKLTRDCSVALEEARARIEILLPQPNKPEIKEANKNGT